MGTSSGERRRLRRLPACDWETRPSTLHLPDDAKHDQAEIGRRQLKWTTRWEVYRDGRAWLKDAGVLNEFKLTAVIASESVKAPA